MLKLLHGPKRKPRPLDNNGTSALWSFLVATLLLFAFWWKMTAVPRMALPPINDIWNALATYGDEFQKTTGPKFTEILIQPATESDTALFRKFRARALATSIDHSMKFESSSFFNGQHDADGLTEILFSCNSTSECWPSPNYSVSRIVLIKQAKQQLRPRLMMASRRNIALFEIPANLDISATRIPSDLWAAVDRIWNQIPPTSISRIPTSIDINFLLMTDSADRRVSWDIEDILSKSGIMNMLEAMSSLTFPYVESQIIHGLSFDALFPTVKHNISLATPTDLRRFFQVVSHRLPVAGLRNATYNAPQVVHLAAFVPDGKTLRILQKDSNPENLQSRADVFAASGDAFSLLTWGSTVLVQPLPEESSTSHWIPSEKTISRFSSEWKDHLRSVLGLNSVELFDWRTSQEINGIEWAKSNFDGKTIEVFAQISKEFFFGSWEIEKLLRLKISDRIKEVVELYSAIEDLTAYLADVQKPPELRENIEMGFEAVETALRRLANFQRNKRFAELQAAGSDANIAIQYLLEANRDHKTTAKQKFSMYLKLAIFLPLGVSPILVLSSRLIHESKFFLRKKRKPKV